MTLFPHDKNQKLSVRGNGLGLQNRRNIVFMKVNNQHHPTLLTSKEHSLFIVKNVHSNFYSLGLRHGVNKCKTCFFFNTHLYIFIYLGIQNIFIKKNQK